MPQLEAEGFTAFVVPEGAGGVLLDIASFRDRKRLESGEPITPDDLDAIAQVRDDRLVVVERAVEQLVGVGAPVHGHLR